MEELFIVKNLLSAAAFGTAFIAERRRNAVAARPGDEADGGPRRAPPSIVEAPCETSSPERLFEVVCQAATRIGVSCAACLSPDARSRKQLLRTFRDDASPEHDVVTLAHCEAAREAQARRTPVLGPPDGRTALRATGLTSVFAAPLGDGDARPGVIAFGTRKPAGFAREDAVLLGGLVALLEGGRRAAPEAAAAPADYRRLDDAVPIPLILADADGVVSALNAACEDLLRVSAGALVGGPVGRCFEALSAEVDVTPLLRRALAEGVPAMFDARHRPPAGRELVIHWRLAVLPTDAPALVICGIDLTDCLAVQEELARAKRLCAAGQLVAGIAHELNNPLTALSGLAELLQEHVSAEPHRGYLQRLLAQAQRCRRIADNLLGFVRRHEPRREPVALDALIAETVELVRYQFDLDGVATVITPAPNLPPVMGDPGEVQQVLINLLINAQQALMEVGGGVVEIAARHDGQGVEVVVRDSGPGIPDHVLPTLFEPFVTTKPEGQGTGLGLSISRELAHKQGGTLEARNRPEGGAEFRLLLSAMDVPAPARSATAASVPESAGAARILVVDDEEPVRLVMREALHRAGHDTDETSDGLEALDLVSERDYDIIICDLHMPGMGGEEFCEQVRETRPELAERIIVTTGDGSTPQARSFLERSGLRCIQKPFSARELAALVNARLAAAGDCSGNAAARGGRE